MTEQEQITEWFMKEFWVTYPAKYCSRKNKGSRAIALKHMLKHKPDEEERKRILANLKAQVRAAAKDPDRKWWKNGETYCYNGLWDDEIDSMMEVEQKTNKIPKCSECDQLSIGPQYTVCGKHLESKEEKLQHTQRLKELGLLTPGLSLSELATRCREWLSPENLSGKNVVKDLKKELGIGQKSPQSSESVQTENAGESSPVGSREWFEENGWTNLDHTHNGLVE